MDMARLTEFFGPEHRWPLQIGLPSWCDGAVLHALAQQGHQVFAAHADPAVVAAMRAAAGGAVLADLAAEDALPWPSHSLDLVLVPAGWRARLDELLRVLRPGGALYLCGAARGMRAALADAGVGWLDQLSVGDDLLALTPGSLPAPAGCFPGAAGSRPGCDPGA